jgi:hypothetical protein
MYIKKIVPELLSKIQNSVENRQDFASGTDYPYGLPQAQHAMRSSFNSIVSNQDLDLPESTEGAFTAMGLSSIGIARSRAIPPGQFQSWLQPRKAA